MLTHGHGNRVDADIAQRTARSDYQYLAHTQASPPLPHFYCSYFIEWSSSSTANGNIQPEYRRQIILDRQRIAKQHRLLCEYTLTFVRCWNNHFPQDAIPEHDIPVFCCHTYINKQNKATKQACGSLARWGSWFCEEHATPYTFHAETGKREVEVPLFHDGEEEYLRTLQLQRISNFSSLPSLPLGDYVVRSLLIF